MMLSHSSIRTLLRFRSISKPCAAFYYTNHELRANRDPHEPSILSPRYELYKQRKRKEARESKMVQKHDEMFEIVKDRQKANKVAFSNAIDVYLKREGVQRRGQVEFIYAAMKRMKEFDVHRDIVAYKKLFSVFPERKMVAQNLWQVEYMHYPKQQYCAIDLLDKMESHGVIPDDDFGYMILRTFGKGTHVMRKYQRMMYWMPKFAHINPWPIPKILPEDPTELACIALRRMAVDLENQISVWHEEELEEQDEDAADMTWIASAQSPMQHTLLEKHDPSQPVYVDGGYHVWVRYKSLTHFVLRADCREDQWYGKPEDEDGEDNLEFRAFYDDEFAVVEKPSVHQQEDGTVLAMAITGTSSKESLKSWIRLLQRSNPALSDLRVVFRMKTPEHGLQVVDEMEMGVKTSQR